MRRSTMPRRTPRTRRALSALPIALLVFLLALLWGLPSAGAEGPNEALLQELLESLTVEERIGQLVMVSFIGTDVGPGSPIGRLVRDYKVGAVLISASNGNVVNWMPSDSNPNTPVQVATLTNELQRRAYEGTRRTLAGEERFLPLFIAVDHEGDDYPTTHLLNRFTTVPSAMAIGATWEPGQAETVGRIVGRELAAVGVNMLLGPVLDVLETPRSGGRGDIGVRSFGGSPAWVGALGRAYIRGVHTGSQGRVLAIAKHFPGHGGSDRTIEDEVATVFKPLDRLQGTDLLPFRTVTRVGNDDPKGTADGLMTSHLRYPSVQGGLTAQTPPVSLDPTGLGAFLALPEFAAWRQDGVLVADSLGVTAIKRYYDPFLTAFPHRRPAREALLAGNDLLPLLEYSLERGWERYQLPNIVDTLQYLAGEYRTNPFVRERVDEAVRRLLRAKLKLYPGLTFSEVEVEPRRAEEEVGRSIEAVYSLARKSLTLVHPSPGELRARLPRPPQPHEQILFVECWGTDCYGAPVLPERTLESMTLELYGPRATGQVRPENVRTISFGQLASYMRKGSEPSPERDEVDALLRDAEWIVFALSEYNPLSFPDSQALKTFLTTPPIDLREKKVIVIAFTGPYHLDATELTRVTAYWAAYSKVRPLREVALRALFGELQAQGRSPVDVAGAGYFLSYQLQPDPAKFLPLYIEGPQGQKTVTANQEVRVAAGPILDRNGNPVPDGTTIQFHFALDGETASVSSAATREGTAVASFMPLRSGTLTVSASHGPLTSPALRIEVAAAPEPASPSDSEEPSFASPSPSSPATAGRRLLLAPLGAMAAALLGGLFIVRRRRQAAPAPVPTAAVPAAPPPLRLDLVAHRVYLDGQELRPPLSREQFRLLAYLYERAGQVCTRQEIALHVWPEAELSGVSEEAVDSLVHRLRERLRRAGGKADAIVTIRGQGFRLDL